MFSCQQMEVLGSVHIFLTPNQRSWMNAIKNAAAKKPKKKIERPEVMTGFRSIICLKPGFHTAGPTSRVHSTGPTQRVPHQKVPHHRSPTTGPTQLVPPHGFHTLHNEHRSGENKIKKQHSCQYSSLWQFSLIQNRYQALVFDMVESRKFEIFIILVITVNMILMMVQHYDQPSQVTLVLDIL